MNGHHYEQQRKFDGAHVTMMRDPVSRVRSGYLHCLHDYKGKLLGCRYFKNVSFSDYLYSVQGCSVKLLEGKLCGDPEEPTEDMIANAKTKLRAFAFVGILEQWNLSICLFHAMYGSTCHPREFLRLRKATKKSPSDVRKDA